MIPYKGEEGWAPSPEVFAAYADGELDSAGPSAALRKQIEGWLVEHPEAAGTVEAQRQVTEWCQVTTAPDPGEPAWTAMAQRLRALPLPPPQGRHWSRRAWLAVLGGTAAAALWLALSQLWPLTRPGVVRNEHTPPGGELPRPPRAGQEADVFEVATAAEVEILSVQGDDTGTLVVGELPVQGALVLLQPGEVTLTSVQPARDNMVPEIRTGPTAPMIWAPLEAEQEDPEDANQG
jgi:hypothetical protein